MLTQQDIYAAGLENRPPMLNKDNYVPWSSHIIRSRPNGKMIVDSTKNGPYVRRMIATLREPDLPVLVPESFHEQTNEELTETDIKRMDADDQAIQTILLDLPEDVYATVDSGGKTGEPTSRVVSQTSNQGGQGSDQGIGAHRGDDELLNFSTVIAQQLQDLLPTIIAQVGNHASNIQGDIRSVNMGNGKNGCLYKEFIACNPKDYDVNEVQTRVREVAVGMTWEDFMDFIRLEFYPNNEMQKLETKFWCHAMVGAGHATYTDRFYKLARLVPYLVTPKNKRIKRYIYGLTPQIRAMVAATEPTTIQSAELGRKENVRDDNKRSKTGRVFAMITKPVRKEYMSTSPKCTNCSFHHNPEMPCRRLPLVKPSAETRRKLQNQPMAIEGGQSHGNNENKACGGAFMMGAEEARQDPNIVTDTVAQKFLNEVKSSLVTLQRVVKQKMTLEVHNWSSSAHKEVYEIISHEITPIINQVDARVQNFEIQFLQEAAKFVRDFKSLAKEADESIDNHLKTTYKNLFDSIASNWVHAKLHNLVYKNAKLRARLFENTSEPMNNTLGTSVTPHVDKPKLSAVTPHSKKLHASMLSHSVPQPKEFNVMKHRNVIVPGIFKINPSQMPRVDLVPNKQSSASIRTNPITNSQRHITFKENVSFDTVTASSTRLVHTAKTRRPQPKGNTRNARIPSASKSSEVKKNVTVEDHRRTLLLFKNQKTMSSECNNIKLAIRNDKSKIIYDTCKQCLVTDNHDACFPSSVNALNSHANKLCANIPLSVNQKRHMRQVWKPKQVGSKERLACNRSINLYTINLYDMASASPICLMACATPTKSWLWHQRLSHLNFDTINDLAKNDLISRLVHTAKTRRPQPKGNTRNARVPSTSKSSEVKKIVVQICLCCVDSSCSKHMTENIKLLINFVWKFLGTVRFGNDHIAVILGYGDLKWGNITITRVYFVEGLGLNLFSVGQFCDADLEVAFRRNTCFIRDLDGVDLLKGNHSINLYTINLYDMASASPICLMARATPTKSWLWHQRLSHLNSDTINDLAKNDLVSGLPKFKYAKEHLCPSCEQGKSKRASHPPKPVSNSKQRLHLLHMDLCGLMRIASINDVIKNFMKKNSVCLQAPIIIVRTNNRTEFKNYILKEYFDSVGITHETSAAKTPQQNGVVKRRNRTLVEAAYVDFLSRSIVPMGCSNFYYVLYLKPALCYPKNDREDIGKLGAKGDIGFFIGYSANSVAYRVYNRRTRKIIKTMNVTFDELSAMAFEQNSSRPCLQSMTSGQIRSELELTYASSTITPQRPSERDLDILFEPLHNEYLGGRPAEAPRAIPAAPVEQNL
nr:retrovirus-related Pol polyprotein from transposon TNT 1-94 [Tanacetum cinerariifolium]